VFAASIADSAFENKAAVCGQMEDTVESESVPAVLPVVVQHDS
jgi:hypothetical protein